MEQHPVPQHIASFEFKLFGNLTVRQFITLAIPMTLAIFIFFSPGPSLIRYPLTVIFAGFGLFAALVPIQGRPFDKWLVAFTRALITPTQRVWVKETKIPEFLNVVVSELKTREESTEPITTQDRQKLLEYLRSLPRAHVSLLDTKEQMALNRLGLTPQVSTGGKLPPPILWMTPASEPIGPIAQPYVSPAFPQEQFQGLMPKALPQITPSREVTSQAKISTHAKPYFLPGFVKKLSQKPPTHIPKVQLASEANFAIENIIPVKTPDKRLRLLHGIAKTRLRKLHFAPPKDFNLANLPIRGEARFEVSEELKRRFQFEDSELQSQTIEPLQPIQPLQPLQETKIEVPHKTKPHRFLRQNSLPQTQTAHITAANVSLKTDKAEPSDSQILTKGKKVESSKPASLLAKAQIIPLTNTPNVLSGLVSDVLGTPLEAAIITVRDQNGIPVRALKTNKLGQFLSRTPLTSGNYSLEIEHLNSSFEPLSISLTNSVLAPLEIKASG